MQRWKNRSGKVVMAVSSATTALILMVAAVLVALTPVTVVVGKPATLNIKAASSYQGVYTSFIQTFPEFTATNLHYNNPLIMGPSGPPTTLTINLGSVSTKVTGTSQHVIAQTLDASINVPVPIGSTWSYQLVQVKCDSLVGDINIWAPDPTGKFGTLVAELKGKVLFHVPNIPGLPSGLKGGYHYEGNALTLIATFYEPVYTIDTTSGLTIAQGCSGSAGVVVAPIDPEITGNVGLGFKWESEFPGGVWFEPGGQQAPPFSATMHINVRPQAPTGTYIGYVIVNDWTTGKKFVSHPITITVVPSG